MHCEFLLESLRKFLAKEDKRFQNRLLLKLQQQLFLNGTVPLTLRNGEQLFKDDKNQFNHVVVLLLLLLNFKAVGEVNHQRADHARLQERFFDSSELAQYFQAHFAVALL